MQCLSQGHFIWVDSCHHEGILQSQRDFLIKQTARTDTGSSNDILSSVLTLSPSNQTPAHSTDHSCSSSHAWVLALAKAHTDIKTLKSPTPASPQPLQQLPTQPAFTAQTSVQAGITTDPRSVMMIAVAGSVQTQQVLFVRSLLIVRANSVLFFFHDGCDNGGDGSGCKD